MSDQDNEKVKDLESVDIENQTDEEVDDVTKVDDIIEAEENTQVQDSSETSKKMENENKELLNRLQRSMAEFDNFRKRTLKEKSMMYENGAKECLEAILPVVDNFERAIGSCEEDIKETAFVKGIEMIYNQLESVLKEIGVAEIEAVGKEFDPNYHNAVTHVEDDEYGDCLMCGEQIPEKRLRFDPSLSTCVACAK